MKKILFGLKLPGFFDNYKAPLLALALFLSSGVFSQSTVPYDSTRNRIDVKTYGTNFWGNYIFGGSLRIPRDTSHLAVSDSGSIAYKGDVIYKWTGYAWSASSGGGSTNTSIGSAYKVAVNGTNNVKSLANTWGMVLDSITSGQVGFSVDTSSGKVATKTDLLTRWSLSGNTGTDTSVNFIGTTDSKDLVIKTNNTRRMTIKSNGSLTYSADSTDVLFDDIDNFEVTNVGSSILFDGRTGGISSQVGITSGYSVTIGTYNISDIPRNSALEIYEDSIGFSPYLGKIAIDSLQNLSSQNKFLGWVGYGVSGVGNIGYLSPGTGIEITSGNINTKWTTSGNNIYNNNSGNVGIGTSSPTSKLHVSESAISGSVTSLYFESIGATTTNRTLRLKAANAVNNIALAIDNGEGDVGIGTLTPAATFHTVGTVRMASLGSASTDTTTYKPVGISSLGDVIPMTAWPGGSSGANTALSNLASVAINTSLLPGTDNSIDVGSGSKQWRYGIYGTGISIGAATAPAAALDIRAADLFLTSSSVDQRFIIGEGLVSATDFYAISWNRTDNQLVFNDGGVAVSMRLEGDNNANLFFADATNDRIGIKTATPDSTLTVSGSAHITGHLKVDTDPLIYEALVTETGGVQSAIVLKNTTGTTFTLSSDNAGAIKINADSGLPFTANKTLVYVSMNADGGGTGIDYTSNYDVTSTSRVIVYTYSGGTATADIANNMSVRIVIYP